MTTLTWHKTGHAPDLLAAWLCDVGDHELVILQHTASQFSAAVRDLLGNVLASSENFSTWILAALWAKFKLDALCAREEINET